MNAETVAANAAPIDSAIPSTTLEFDPASISFRLATQELLKRGIPVIPIPPKQKGCQLKDWPALATNDPAVIDAWKKNGLNQNAGAVAKPEGFCIVDWDDLSLIEQLPQALPKTLTVKSAKGLHYYFKQTDATRALGNTHMEDPADPKHRLFDFQQCDKYVVAPHSIHPDGPIYTIVDPSEIIDCPDWLTAWLKEKGQPQPILKKSGLVIEGTKITPEQLEHWLELHDCNVYAGTWHENTQRWMYLLVDQCPWEEEHTGKNAVKDAAVFIGETGLGFHCCHS